MHCTKIFVIAGDRLRSNHTHKFDFVVQAYSSVDGWQDTKHGANTQSSAILKAVRLLDDNTAWIVGKKLASDRKVRVVPVVLK